MAFLSVEPGYPEILVRSYPDLAGGIVVSTLDVGLQTSATSADPREGRAPVFSRDGRELFYQSGTAVVSVPIEQEWPFRSGMPRVAFSGAQWPWVTEGRHYDPHPDGRRFIRIRVERDPGEASSTDLVVITNWTRLLEDDSR